MATFSPATLAPEFGTDAKNLRKFLRKAMPDAAPGKGGRWSIELNKTEMKKLQKQFNEWQKAQLEERAARAAEKAAAAAEVVEDDVEELED